MKRDTNAAGQHAEPDKKPGVPPSVRWKKYSVTTRCSNICLLYTSDAADE